MTRKPLKCNQKPKTPTADKLRKIADEVAKRERCGDIVTMEFDSHTSIEEVTTGGFLPGTKPDEVHRFTPGKIDVYITLSLTARV